METELAVVYAEATDIVELNWKHMNGEGL